MWLTPERRLGWRRASLVPRDAKSYWTNESVLITMKKVPHFQPSLEGNRIQDTEGISYQPIWFTHIHLSLLPLPRPGFSRRGLERATPRTVWGNCISEHSVTPSSLLPHCSALFPSGPCAHILRMSKTCLIHEDVLKRLEILTCLWGPTRMVITHQWLIRRNFSICEI